MTEAYPLAWPEGWPRTPVGRRLDGRRHFGRFEEKEGQGYQSKRALTFSEARKSLFTAAAKVKASNLVVSTNFTLNQSGLPHGGRGRPSDEGVAIYFTRGGVALAMARDAYERAEENMRSLAMALEAMAALERHGGSGLAGRAFTGFTALPAPKKAHEILGVSPGASKTEITAAYRARIAGAHPDQGGSHAAAAELNAARDEMLKGAAHGG